MLLYLVQHAEAKSAAEDPQRDLTAKGRREVGALVAPGRNGRDQIGRLRKFSAKTAASGNRWSCRRG